MSIVIRLAYSVIHIIRFPLKCIFCKASVRKMQGNIMFEEPDERPNGQSESKRPHPFISDVKKMLRECNLQWKSPLVVANLTLVAEKMAIELLKDAVAYSYKDNTSPISLTKSDIELAIRLKHQDEVNLPDEDALIDAAVAVNGNPLVMKEIDGIALPKNHIGNCNYRLQNSGDLMEMEEEIEEPESYYTYIMPYDNYLPNNHANMEDYMYNNALPQQNQQHQAEKPMMLAAASPRGSESPSSMYDDTIPPENYGFCYDD